MNSIINQEIRIKDFVPGFITPKQGSNKKLELYEGKNCIVLKSNISTVITDKYMSLNENDFIAIGLYLAEGEKYINEGRAYNHSGEISFANNDLGSVLIVIRLLEKFGITAYNLRWKIGLNIKYSQNADKAREYWIKNLGLDINKARPRWLYITGDEYAKLTISSNEVGYIQIFYSSMILRNLFLSFIDKIFGFCVKYKLKKELALILKGYFAGDGNVDYSERFNRKQVEFTCHDNKLIEKIRGSLNILGLKSIRETWPEKTKTHSKALRIYNKHDFEILDEYEIPYLIDYKKERFKQILNSY